MGSVRLFLTDDLKYLVESHRGQKGNGTGTFDVNGKTYDLAKFGLTYSRPDAEPNLYPTRQYRG